MSPFAALDCGDFIEFADPFGTSGAKPAHGALNARIRDRMRMCEIIYVKEGPAKGWKWRTLGEQGELRQQTSVETFQLFYDCVSAARAKGYVPNVKCP